MDRLDSFADIVSGLEPRDIIGALMVGFVVSLCSAAVYMVYRRKVTDALSLLVGLMFVVSAASMVLAVGLLRASTEARQMQDGPFNGMSFDGQPPVGPMFGAHAAWGTNWPREPHSIAQRRIQGE